MSWYSRLEGEMASIDRSGNSVPLKSLRSPPRPRPGPVVADRWRFFLMMGTTLFCRGRGNTVVVLLFVAVVVFVVVVARVVVLEVGGVVCGYGVEEEIACPCPFCACAPSACNCACGCGIIAEDAGEDMLVRGDVGEFSTELEGG